MAAGGWLATMFVTSPRAPPGNLSLSVMAWIGHWPLAARGDNFAPVHAGRRVSRSVALRRRSVGSASFYCYFLASRSSAAPRPETPHVGVCAYVRE